MRNRTMRGAWAAALGAAALGAAWWLWAPSAEGHEPSGRAAERPGPSAAASLRTGPPQLDTPDAESLPITGTVVERLGAGPYTYLRVESAGGASSWVVTLGGGSQLGADVRVRSMGTKDDFRSARLGRTFDRLTFGIVTTR